MVRSLSVAAVVLAFGSRAWAGGPPPVFVVVDKVVLEPNTDAPERIRIEGCFVRQDEALLREMKEKGLPWERTYGKPVEGSVYLSIEPGKEKECRAEWAEWQKAARTGKVVAVGACVHAGSLLTVKIRRPEENTTRPDAVYTTDYLEAGGQRYVEGDHATFGLRFEPVKDLLAFAKARQLAKRDNTRQLRSSRRRAMVHNGSRSGPPARRSGRTDSREARPPAMTDLRALRRGT